MSKIHFIGGEKGGVGKSVLSRLLAQYHIDNGHAFTAFDTDRSHGAMLRFYGDYSRPISLDRFESADELVEAAVDAPAPRNIIVDLASQTALPLFRWIDQNDLLGLTAEEGIPVLFWHVMDDGADGLALLQRLLNQCGDGASYVVVRNHGRGKDFSALDVSPTRTAAETLGAAFIDLPELHAPTMRKVDHLNASFWAAVQNKASGLGLMERQRVKVWTRKAYAQFDALGSLLLDRPQSQTQQTISPPAFVEGAQSDLIADDSGTA